MTTEPTIEQLRAWWGHRRGLDGTLHATSPAEVLARTGWSRSVGGCTPYLTLFARAGIDREVVDQAVADLDIHELPSARGCTYVLPREHFELGLTVGAGAPLGEIAAAEKHLGVTRAEIDKLCAGVVDTLESASGPLDPTEIRNAVGGAVRNLGEAGKKRGQTTTLPMALGLLQAQGEIRRVPINGRLDQQRFSYVRWSPSPLRGLDAEAARAELARLYFSWAGPASLKHFRWFSAFSATAAKQAVAALDLRPVAGTELLVLPEDEDAFGSFTVPKKPSWSLVTNIDGIHLLHRDYVGRFVEQEHAARQAPGAKPGRTIGDDPDPQCPIIVDRGRMAGLWEYDPDAKEIVYQVFTKPDAALKKTVKDTEAYVRDQLGDARLSVLDSPKSRAPRIAALRG